MSRGERSNISYHRGDIAIRGYVVGQAPNPPIIVAVLAAAASWLLSEDSAAWSVARAIFYVSLSIWAWLELAHGVNLFRRLLGLVGLVVVVAGVLRDVG